MSARVPSFCPATGGDHDWRYASHAPGWRLGDTCAICQSCKLRTVTHRATDAEMARMRSAQ